MLPKLNQDFGVRALMGTIAVIGAVITLAWITIVDNNTQAMQILGNALIAVIAFYFGQKAGQSVQPPQ